jgi:hypothetical protein
MALNMADNQTKGTGREGEHIQRICIVVVAVDALHRQYDHHDW